MPYYGKSSDADLLDGLDSTYFAPLNSPALIGTPTAPTAAAGTSTTQVATTAFVTTADNTLLSNHLAATDPHPQYTTAAELETRIAALVASAPAALDTLNELATALGDDPNFATTVTNALAGKAPIASPTFTGKVIVPQGNAANPGLAFTGDISNDTGLYLNADGNLGVTCNGSQVASFTPGAVNLQGTATGTSFNGITALASSVPLAPGSAAVGTSTAVARQDHVHPLQTTLSASAPITTVAPYKVTAITGATSGSINIPNVQFASGELFATALHQTTTVPAGWMQHISIGAYRDGTASYNGGLFVGLGGNDNNPTEYYKLGFGGNITHSSGSTFWNNLNDGAGSGLDADLLDGHDSTYFAPLSSPALTGTPTAPTAAAGTSTTQLATTAFVTAADNLKANIASPVFTGQVILPEGTAALPGLSFQNDGGYNTGLYHPADDVIGVSCGNTVVASFTITGLNLQGTPTAPTATAGTNTTQLATTAFVTAANNSLQSQVNTKAPIASPVFTGRVTGPTGSGSSGGFGFDSDTGMVSSGDGNLKFYTNNVYAGGPITGTNNWDINITGNATNATTSIYTTCSDGDRNAGNKLPTTSGHSVRYDFANSNTAGNPGSAFCGVMTYAPWDGTSGSTGSQSYQLSYGSNVQNTGTIPVLQIRNGIDSTWNQWYKIWHSGNGGSGSGLDADLLDGYDSTYFAPISSVTAADNNLQAQINGKQNYLGFTPVQQGTGIGQSNNTIKLGWSGSRLKATVDNTDLGNILTTANVSLSGTTLYINL